MKKHLARITAVLLILTFSAGLVTGCNGSNVMPIDGRDDYYDDKDDDRRSNDDKETEKTTDTEDDDIRVAKDDPVIPDIDDDNSNVPADTNDTNDNDDDNDAIEPEETVTEDTSPTEKPIGKTKVSNAYKKSFKTKYLGKVTSSYPKVTIEGVDTSAVNKEIKKDIDSKAKKHKVTYIYYIGKKYVSILVTIVFDSDWEESDHFVYNISRITGKKLSRNSFLSSYGISSSSFESRAKKAIQKYWKKYKYHTMDKKAYAKAYSKNTLKKALAYVNKKGKLCYLVKSMELPVGGNYYDVTGTC